MAILLKPEVATCVAQAGLLVLNVYVEWLLQGVCMHE